MFDLKPTDKHLKTDVKKTDYSLVFPFDYVNYLYCVRIHMTTSTSNAFTCQGMLLTVFCMSFHLISLKISI